MRYLKLSVALLLTVGAAVGTVAGLATDVRAEEPAAQSQPEPASPSPDFDPNEVPRVLLRAIASERMPEEDRDRFCQRILNEFRAVAVPMVAQSLREDGHTARGASKLMGILQAVDTEQAAELMSSYLASVSGSPLIAEPAFVSDWAAFCKLLKDAAAPAKDGEKKQDSPARRIVELLPPALMQEIGGLADGTADKAATWVLLDGINNLLYRRDLYDEVSFAGVTLDPRIRRLMQQKLERVAPQHAMQLNRVLLTAAFPQLPAFEASDAPGDMVGRAIFTAFAKMTTPNAKDALLRYVPLSDSRSLAQIDGLAVSDEAQALDLLIGYLSSPIPVVSASARKALVAKAEKTNLYGPLSKVLSEMASGNAPGFVTQNVLETCVATGDATLSGHAFSQTLTGTLPSRRAALSVLAKHPEQGVRPEVLEGMKSLILAELELSQASEDKKEKAEVDRILILALDVLMKGRAPEAAPVAGLALASKSSPVLNRTCEVLQALTRRTLGPDPQLWRRWLQKQEQGN